MTADLAVIGSTDLEALDPTSREAGFVGVLVAAALVYAATSWRDR